MVFSCHSEGHIKTESLNIQKILTEHYFIKQIEIEDRLTYSIKRSLEDFKMMYWGDGGGGVPLCLCFCCFFHF